MKDLADKVTPDFPEMEGDFFFDDDPTHDDGQADEGREEQYLHFIMGDFEAALYQYGLDNLLGQMSTDGAYELLQQARRLIQDHEKGCG